MILHVVQTKKTNKYHSFSTATKSVSMVLKN